MKTALGIGIVLLLAMGTVQIAALYELTEEPLVQVDAMPVGLSEQQRREVLLMPKPDSAAWQEWVGKYGDNADSWELFTLQFHTKYLSRFDARLRKIERMLEPNEPNEVRAADKRVSIEKD